MAQFNPIHQTSNTRSTFVLGVVCIVQAMIFALLGGLQAMASGFEFVQTTGRAVIMHQDAEQEARMMALEDALYTAALQGGAEINGFSIITTDTAIDDHFVVRPASRILDYRIVNEVVEEEHYAVTIEAAVGDLPDAQCDARGHSNVTVYAPTIRVAATAQAWTRQFADMAMRDVVMMLDEQPSLNVQVATGTRLDPAALARSNDTFDYTALTSGRVRVGRGDYAIIPQINLFGEVTRGFGVSNQRMTMQLNLRLLAGEGYETLLEHQLTKVIEIEQSSLIRSLDVVSRPKRHAILAEMRAPIAGYISEFATKLLCRPVRSTLNYADGTLTIPLGTHHGVGVNSLAVASGTDTPWQILRVSAAGPMTATLTPLNNQRQTAGLAGQAIEFMELN